GVKRSIGGVDIDFVCRSAINVGGEVDERERYWHDACKDSDYIFYLVDADKMQKDEAVVLKRVEDDLDWFATHIGGFKAGRKLYILLNKIDLLTEERTAEKVKQVFE